MRYIEKQLYSSNKYSSNAFYYTHILCNSLNDIFSVIFLDLRVHPHNS